MFIFPFILKIHFLMFQVQSLLIIKSNNILTSRNTFVIYNIHISFPQHYTSFCIFIFYVVRKRLNEFVSA
jgi:hypothetical protein